MSREANAAGCSGKLLVTVHRCAGLPDKQLIGTQEPYVKLECGSEKFKTHHDKGLEPKFEQAFIFNLKGVEDLFHIHVYDLEVLSDRSIGRCDLRIRDIVLKKGMNPYELVDKDNFAKRAGYIYITFDFQGQYPPGLKPAEPEPTPSQPLAHNPIPSPSPVPASIPAPAPVPAPVQSQSVYPQIPPSQVPQQPVYNNYPPAGQSPYPNNPPYNPNPAPYNNPYPYGQNPSPAPVYSPPPAFAPGAGPAAPYNQFVHPVSAHQVPVSAPVEWGCSQCTFLNQLSDTRCAMCQKPRY